MSEGRWCRPNRHRHSKPNGSSAKTKSSASTGELPSNRAVRKTSPSGTSSVSLSAVDGASQPLSALPGANAGGTTSAKRREQPQKPFRSFASDEDACCVQAFTKSASFVAATAPHPCQSLSSAQIGSPRARAPEGANKVRTSLGRGSSNGQSPPHGNVNEGGHDRRGRGPMVGDGGLVGPVFYRVAWRRTGDKRIVWKIRSR